MITLVLHGKLGERFSHPVTRNRWRIDAATPAQALNYMDTIIGGFFQFIEELESEMQGYHVQIDEKDVGAIELGLMCDDSTVTITPLLQGADTKGVIQIVAGVALIAVGVYLAWTPIGGLSATIGIQMIGLGLAVSLGGVARLLMSAPDQTVGTQDKTKSSYVFSGTVNTIQQGECMPVCYGNPIIGSAVVAAGIVSEDILT